MSGEGLPTLDTDGTGLKVTIVSGLWHTRISEGLLAGAHRVLDASGAEVSIVQVAGSFELPVVSKAALEAGADAVVALGVIVRGETPHFDFVASAATDGLTRVALDTGKPVGFGGASADVLLGVGEPRAVEPLLLVLDGQHTESDRLAGVERDPG